MTTPAYSERPAARTCLECGETGEYVEETSSFHVRRGIRAWKRPLCRCERQAQESAAERRARESRLDRVRAMLQRCGIEGRFEGKTFEAFHPPAIDRGAFEATKAYAEGFQPKGYYSLYLWSQKSDRIPGTGNGKTHLASAVARHIIQVHERPAIFLKAVGSGGLYDLIQSTYDKDQDPDQRRARLRLIEELPRVDLLVLDDLDKKRPTASAVETLYGIVNDRYLAGLPIIVTSNTPLPELARRFGGSYGTAIVDRITEMCKRDPAGMPEGYIEFLAPSYRQMGILAAADGADDTVFDRI